MDTYLYSKRYAQASFELALENEGVDTWHKTLVDVKKILSTDRFYSFLSLPSVHVSLKISQVSKLLTGALHYVCNLIYLLIQRNHISLFPQIVKEFELLVDKMKGILRGKILVATPIEQDTLDSIYSAIASILDVDVNQLALETVVDSSIVGGTSVYIGSKLIDFSLHARLQALHRSLINRSFSVIVQEKSDDDLTTKDQILDTTNSSKTGKV